MAPPDLGTIVRVDDGPMQRLTRDIGYIDLRFQNQPEVIAAAVLHGSFGAAIVDPGPASTLPRLGEELRRHGIDARDVRTILLTHIHFDHAGATGALVAETPGIEVYVHAAGMRHMADPSRLVASARQLWGDELESLWGEFLPVPEANLRQLDGGERIRIGERELDVAYTPGHARHHVSYFDRDSGIAFVGDAAGIRVGSVPYLLAPTPPPDIDLAAWRGSIETIQRWSADTLFVTHFGPHADTVGHLGMFVEHLDELAEIARRIVASGAGKDGLATFVAEVEALMRRRLPESTARHYEEAAPLKLCWLGLERYWQKQGVGGAA